MSLHAITGRAGTGGSPPLPLTNVASRPLTKLEEPFLEYGVSDFEEAHTKSEHSAHFFPSGSGPIAK